MQIMCSDRKQIYHRASPAPWEQEGVEGLITKGHEETLLWCWCHRCIAQDLSNCTLRHVQFILFQLYLNKTVKNNVRCNKEWPLSATTAYPAEDGQARPWACLSLLLVWEMLHASHLLSLWLISEWKNGSKVFKLVKPKQETPVKAKLTVGPYLEGSFDSLTPSLIAHLLPANSREVCSRPGGLTSLPTLRILPSSQLKTVLQKNKIMMEAAVWPHTRR